jgi:hypothetical protein
MARLAQVPAQHTPHVTEGLKLQGVSVKGHQTFSIVAFLNSRFWKINTVRRMVVRYSGMLQGSKRLKRAGSDMVSVFATVSIGLDGIGIDISRWIVNLDLDC